MNLRRRLGIVLGLGLGLAGAAALADTGTAETRSGQVLLITQEDVVRKVSAENYSVHANALRVYQAREGIQVARGNLLPRLNLWNVVNFAFDWTSALGAVQDIAPFLVPSNWFRFEESKLLYLAEKEGYRALWANELMTAKALYVHLLLDQSLLEHIRASEKGLQDLLVIVRSREALGGTPQGVSRNIEVRLLSLLEDKRSLAMLIAEEESLLSYMMGFPAGTQIEPAPVAMPELGALQPLDYTDFEFRALDSSPELRQFDHFVAAADFVAHEARYAFLGTSEMSRGVAGGIFDSLPLQQGLGFGTGASVRIAAAQKALLQTQRKGVEEVLKRQLRLLVGNYNSDLENYANLKRRVELTNEANSQLYERLRLGQAVDSADLIEASRNHIEADTALFAMRFRFLANQDKLARLIFHGDYNKPPAEIEVLREGGRK